MTNEQENDAAIEALNTYKELRRRLEAQAPRTMSAFNAAKVYDCANIDAPPEVIDTGIAELWKLEELEKAFQPYLDAGFPNARYERPDLSEKIVAHTSDPWDAWSRQSNVIQRNSDTGRRF